MNTGGPVKKSKRAVVGSRYLVLIPRFAHPDGTMEVLVEDEVLKAMNDPGLLWVDFMEKAKTLDRPLNQPFYFNTEGKMGSLELMAFVDITAGGPTTFISLGLRG